MHLKSPHGLATRPATDLVRGALFSSLESMDVKWDRVLDLFAGTGALGIEALSRGASWVDFVEQNLRACALIKQNLVQGEFNLCSHVYCTGVSTALTFLKEPYDIIIMDPPYDDRGIHAIILRLSTSNLCPLKGIVVVLHSSRVALNQAYGDLLLLKQRKHGDTSLSFFRKEGAV